MDTSLLIGNLSDENYRKLFFVTKKEIRNGAKRFKKNLGVLGNRIKFFFAHGVIVRKKILERARVKVLESDSKTSGVFDNTIREEGSLQTPRRKRRDEKKESNSQSQDQQLERGIAKRETPESSSSSKKEGSSQEINDNAPGRAGTKECLQEISQSSRREEKEEPTTSTASTSSLKEESREESSQPQLVNQQRGASNTSAASTSSIPKVNLLDVWQSKLKEKYTDNEELRTVFQELLDIKVEGIDQKTIYLGIKESFIASINPSQANFLCGCFPSQQEFIKKIQGPYFTAIPGKELLNRDPTTLSVEEIRHALDFINDKIASTKNVSKWEANKKEFVSQLDYLKLELQKIEEFDFFIAHNTAFANCYLELITEQDLHHMANCAMEFLQKPSLEFFAQRILSFLAEKYKNIPSLLFVQLEEIAIPVQVSLKVALAHLISGKEINESNLANYLATLKDTNQSTNSSETLLEREADLTRLSWEEAIHQGENASDSSILGFLANSKCLDGIQPSQVLKIVDLLDSSLRSKFLNRVIRSEFIGALDLENAGNIYEKIVQLDDRPNWFAFINALSETQLRTFVQQMPIDDLVDFVTNKNITREKRDTLLHLAIVKSSEDGLLVARALDSIGEGISIYESLGQKYCDKLILQESIPLLSEQERLFYQILHGKVDLENIVIFLNDKTNLIKRSMLYSLIQHQQLEAEEWETIFKQMQSSNLSELLRNIILDENQLIAASQIIWQQSTTRSAINELHSLRKNETLKVNCQTMKSCSSPEAHALASWVEKGAPRRQDFDLQELSEVEAFSLPLSEIDLLEETEIEKMSLQSLFYLVDRVVLSQCFMESNQNILLRFFKVKNQFEQLNEKQVIYLFNILKSYNLLKSASFFERIGGHNFVILFNDQESRELLFSFGDKGLQTLLNNFKKFLSEKEIERFYKERALFKEKK